MIKGLKHLYVGRGWDCPAWTRCGPEDLSDVDQYLTEGGVKKMEPGSYRHPVTGQEAQIEIQEITLRHKQKLFLILSGWPSPGTGRPEKLWSLHPWRY